MKEEKWRKNCRQYAALPYVLAVMVFLSGCGGTGSSHPGRAGENEIIQEETAYVAESVPLPEYAALDAAWADAEGLYYLAAEPSAVSGKAAMSCYRLKPGATEPERLFALPLAENQIAFSLTRDANGNFYLLGYQTDETPGGSQDSSGGALPEGMLWKLDLQGKMLLTLPLAEIIKSEDSGAAWQAVDSEGRIFLSRNQDIFVCDPAGKLLFETRAGGQVFGMVSRGGKVLVEYMDTGGAQFKEIDVTAEKLVSVCEMPGGPYRLMAAGNGSLQFADGESVYRYEPETKQLFKKFDWMGHDYAGPASNDFVLPYGENGVAVISRNGNTSPVRNESKAFLEVTNFRELAEGETVAPPVEKKVITIGEDSTSSYFSYGAAVAEFNKTNPEYKIEVKYYDGDLDRLYADVISGDGPDIISSRFEGWDGPMESLGNIGALEDLYSYIDADESLSREDFFENILKAYETRGSLFTIPIWYVIRSMVVPTSLAGEQAGWSLEEFFDFSQELPEGRAMFDASSKSAVLHILSSNYTGQLARTVSEGGQAAANPISRELLTEILAYANQYEDDEDYQYDSAATTMTKVQEGQVKQLYTSVRQANDYGSLSRVFGEPVTFMGVPSPTGAGNLVIAYESFAINAGSKHKEGAWQFLSQLLSKESLAYYHDAAAYGARNGFYIRKDTLDYHFDMWRERFRNDEEIPYSMRMPYQAGLMAAGFWYPPDESAEADLEQVRQLILSVDMAYRPVQAVDAIIEEEAAYYFDGAKPLDEVVDVIMNRVQTYIDEMQ